MILKRFISLLVSCLQFARLSCLQPSFSLLNLHCKTVVIIYMPRIIISILVVWYLIYTLLDIYLYPSVVLIYFQTPDRTCPLCWPRVGPWCASASRATPCSRQVDIRRCRYNIYSISTISTGGGGVRGGPQRGGEGDRAWHGGARTDPRRVQVGDSSK